MSSISFVLHDNFTFILKFEYSELVHLSNISIYGNGYHGCSSIISKESALDFDNARFIGIKGFLGAAVMMLSSNITFRGNNLFAGNTAYSGGSIYLADSRLKLNGAYQFLHNTFMNFSRDLINRTMISCNYKSMREIELLASGGAIFCNNSYLGIYNFSNLTDNTAGWGGGAVMLTTCSLTIQGNASFIRNRANDYGGAVKLLYTNSTVNGSLLLNKNVAYWGGALYI